VFSKVKWLLQAIAVEGSKTSLQTDYILKVHLAKTYKFMHDLAGRQIVTVY
jgi:hypothetical protein